MHTYAKLQLVKFNHSGVHAWCLQSTEVAAAIPPPDDWELDAVEIKFQERIASGAFGDLYKGTYCGQDVAIKILRNVQDDSQQYAEFLQVCSAPCGLLQILHVSL